MSKPTDDKLATLLTEDKSVLAAHLFVVSFTPDVQSPLEFRKIRAQLASMAGLGRLKMFSGYGPDFVLGVDLVLRWERAMLAARTFAGDSATMYLLLLSDGDAVRRSPDPYTAALAAIQAGTP